MSTHSWRHVRYLTLGLIVAVAGLVSMMASGGTANAAPAGAATNLRVYNQECLAGGNVLVSIAWNPSNRGTQWFDVSRSSNFSGFQNQGPLASNAYYLGWVLDDNTTYYGRVATFANVGILNSDTLQFHTMSCGSGFSPPTIVDLDVFNDFVRVDWTAGNSNLFYCVDTAFTQSNLLNTNGSWRNWGCGTTNTSIDLNNLACGRQHFLRVWAAGPGTSGYSQVVDFVSQPCDVNFVPPSNPRETAVGETSATLRWDAGNEVFFQCVDLAQSEDDLEDLDNTWFNVCGAAGTTATITGLQCETTYWWRVWAAGPGTSGYSGMDTFTTGECEEEFVPPTDLDEDILGDFSVRFEWNEQSAATMACVDVAESEDDLTGLEDTFANYCNGGDEERIVNADQFDCGDEYFWRVFARGPSGQGYSVIESFVYDDDTC